MVDDLCRLLVQYFPGQTFESIKAPSIPIRFRWFPFFFEWKVSEMSVRPGHPGQKCGHLAPFVWPGVQLNGRYLVASVQWRSTEGHVNRMANSVHPGCAGTHFVGTTLAGSFLILWRFLGPTLL